MISLLGFLAIEVGVQGEPVDTARLDVMSFNIRYGDAADGPDRWELRRDGVVDRVKAHRPMVFGVQEALGYQVEFIAEHFPDYEWVGVGRDDGKMKGELSAIFMRKGLRMGDRSGTRWISLTPEVAGTLGGDATLPRVFTWVVVRVEGKEILVINTHWDHRSESARLLGAEQISAFADTHPGMRTVLMGDFNCDMSSAPVRKLIEGGFQPLGVQSGPRFTFNAFNPEATGGGLIDHVFYRGALASEGIVVDDSKMKNGRFPSDHFPVLASFVVR